MNRGDYYQSYYGSLLTIDVGFDFNFLVIYASTSSGSLIYTHDETTGMACAGSSNSSTYLGANFSITVYSTYFTHGKPNTILVNGTYYWLAFIL